MGEWDTAHSVNYYRQRIHLQHTISSFILWISCVDVQNFLLILRAGKQK